MAMTEHQRLVLLAAIMMICAVVSGVVVISLLYHAALDQTERRLVEIVRGRAEMISAVAEYDYRVESEEHGTANAREVAAAKTLSQAIDAHQRFKGFGRTGEFTLARLDGDSIRFLLSHRHDVEEAPHATPFESELAQPMRLALRGKSGTIVGLDYRGAEVLAAYQPIPFLELGVVAKMDLAEVRAPFIQAGAVAGGICFVIVVLGVFLFWRVSSPMIKQLSESEERLQLALEGAQDGFWDWDLQTGTVTYSSRWASMLGYSSEELTPDGSTFANLLHPDDADRAERAFKDHLTGQARHLAVEIRLRCKDGTWKWILSRGRVVSRDSSGRPLRMSGTHYDISERKVAQDERRRSEARVRAVFEHSPVGIALTDVDGNTLLSNQTLQRLIGISEAEVANRPLVDLLKPGQTAVELQLHETLVKGTRQKYQIEKELLREDGRRYWASINVGAIRNDSGRLEAMIFLIADISGRKRAEAALRESEAKFRTITQSSADAIFIADPSGNYGYANEAASRLLGYSIQELQTLGIRDVVPREQALAVSEDLNKVMEDKRLFTEVELVRKDGSVIPVDLNAVLLPNGLLYGSCRDISDRRRAEAALRESHALLDATGRMARVGG